MPRRVAGMVGSFGLVLLATATTAPAADESSAFASVPTKGEARFIPAADVKAIPERFRLKPHTFEFETEFERTSGPVRITKVRFPSPVETDVPENNTVHGQYFQPEGKGPYPAVVVLHILGGEFPLSQMTANGLARRGTAALFIKMPYYGERRSRESSRRMISRDPHETVEGMTQAVLDIRRAAAWLASRPEIDADRLGVTGISLGGIMSALSASAEPRFEKVAIYLGGGNLGEAVWNLQHKDADTFRAKWLAAGGTRESFVETLSPIDPCTHAARLRGRDVLMVCAKHDEIIPPAGSKALWKEAGCRRDIVWLDAGHITAAQFLYGEMERLGTFFAPDQWTTAAGMAE